MVTVMGVSDVYTDGRGLQKYDAQSLFAEAEGEAGPLLD
jgi:hypothetical protein